VLRDAQQALRVVTNEPAEPQKIAADQMDGRETRGQAKALFGQPGHSTCAAHRPDCVCGNRVGFLKSHAGHCMAGTAG